MIFAVGLLAQFALLLFSLLREMPGFWLNSGGYPEWLRSLVGIGYYPFLGVVTALHWGLPPWRRSQRGLDWFLWSVSLGVASRAPALGELPAQRIERADVQFYAAKQRGRKQVQSEAEGVGGTDL